MSERLRTSAEQSVEVLKVIQDSKLLKIEGEESESEEMPAALLKNVIVSNSSPNKSKWFDESRLDSSNEAKFAILALHRNRVEKRKSKKEKFRIFLNMPEKPKKTN